MYKNYEEPSTESSFNQMKNPFYFWGLLEDEHEELRKLAILLLSVGVYLAFVEIFWSRYGQVNTKSRNGLTPKNVRSAAILSLQTVRQRKQKRFVKKKPSSQEAAASSTGDHEILIARSQEEPTEEETLDDENLNDLLQDTNVDADDGHQGFEKTTGYKFFSLDDLFAV